MNPFGNDYDIYGNPINVGLYSMDEHIAMHQQLQGMGGINPMLHQGVNPLSQQGMPTGQIGVYPQQRHRATTKKDILTYIQNFTQPSDVEQVSEFDTVKTRHICRGYKEIVLLDKQVIQVPTYEGIVYVEVFFCPRCRKLLINSQSLEVL